MKHTHRRAMTPSELDAHMRAHHSSGPLIYQTPPYGHGLVRMQVWHAEYHRAGRLLTRGHAGTRAHGRRVCSCSTCKGWGWYYPTPLDAAHMRAALCPGCTCDHRDPVPVTRPDPWHTSTPSEGTDRHGDPVDEHAARGANLAGGSSRAPYPGDDLPW